MDVVVYIYGNIFYLPVSTDINMRRASPKIPGTCVIHKGSKHCDTLLSEETTCLWLII